MSEAVVIAGHPLWHFGGAAAVSLAMFVTMRVVGGWRPMPRSGRLGPASGVPILLAGWAGGSLAFGVVVTALSHWPGIVQARGQGGAARLVLLSAVIGLAVVVALALAWHGPVLLSVPLVLVGFGGAWTLWGLLDQHLLKSFVLTPQSVWAGPWDGLFHGVGVTVAAIGVWMATRGRRGTAARSGARGGTTVAAPMVQRSRETPISVEAGPAPARR